MILGLLYGCGLRFSEAIQIKLKDLVGELLFVRKGKREKQRYVPISSSVKEDILEYLGDGRNVFLKDQESELLLISKRGKALQSLDLRLNVLKKFQKSASE